MDHEKQRQKRLDIRLDEWGEYRAETDSALGYKMRSAESRLREDGRTRQVKRPIRKREAAFVGEDGETDIIEVPAQEARCKETQNIRPRDPNYGGARDRVLDVERGYHELREPRKKAALIIYYEKGLRDKRAAQEFGTSVAQFYAVLAQARAFMMGWLRIR